MTNKIKIQLGLILVLLILAVSLILSQRAAPDNPPLFALKRTQEKVFLKMRSKPLDRLEYMSSLLNNRLDELRILVNNHSYGYILPASSRYSTLAGQITDLILTNNWTDQATIFKQRFSDHQLVLNDLYVIYPKNINNWEWKYLQDDYNYLKIYLDQLSKIK